MVALKALGSIFAIILLVWFLASVTDVGRAVEAIISGVLFVVDVAFLIWYCTKK